MIAICKILSNTNCSRKNMVSQNQWKVIGEFMDETARNLRIITFVIVFSFIANIFAGIWFISRFN